MTITLSVGLCAVPTRRSASELQILGD